MRSVSLGGVDHQWHAAALVVAGLSLGAVGGFVGSLLQERGALSAARGTTSPMSRRHVVGLKTEAELRAEAEPDAGTITGRPMEMRA